MTGLTSPSCRSLLLAIAILVLAGCATVPTPPGPAAPATPPAPVVAPPAPVAPPVVVAKPATITGSEESSTMFDNFTVYVAAVDGQPVAVGRAGWNTPLALPAGLRRLTVEFSRGVFTARTDLQFTAKPEAIYQLKFATDAQIFGKNSYCDFSIIDTATGQSVAGPLRVPLSRVAKPE